MQCILNESFPKIPNIEYVFAQFSKSDEGDKTWPLEAKRLNRECETMETTFKSTRMKEHEKILSNSLRLVFLTALKNFENFSNLKNWAHSSIQEPISTSRICYSSQKLCIQKTVCLFLLDIACWKVQVAAPLLGRSRYLTCILRARGSAVCYRKICLFVHLTYLERRKYFTAAYWLNWCRGWKFNNVRKMIE